MHMWYNAVEHSKHSYIVVIYWIYKYTQVYTSVHWYTQVYTSTHWYTPVYAGIHQYTQVYTSMRKCTQVYTIGLGDIENSTLRLLQQKTSRLLLIYCIMFTIINRAQHHYTRVLLVNAIASGMKTFLLV